MQQPRAKQCNLRESDIWLPSSFLCGFKKDGHLPEWLSFIKTGQ